MKQEDSPHWITITMESEEAEQKVRDALDSCKSVHEWAMMKLREKWTYSSAMKVGANDMVHAMTEFIWEKGIRPQAQRYSFVTALAQAVSRFNKEVTVQIGERKEGVMNNGETLMQTEARIFFPEPAMPEEYRVIDVQSRSIWRRYMTNYDRISTYYGLMFLEGEWRKTLSDQACEQGISPDLIPFLIYSVSVRENGLGWQLHFNLHSSDSANGKKRTKQSWERGNEKLDTV